MLEPRYRIAVVHFAKFLGVRFDFEGLEHVRDPIEVGTQTCGLDVDNETCDETYERVDFRFLLRPVGEFDAKKETRALVKRLAKKGIFVLASSYDNTISVIALSTDAGLIVGGNVAGDLVYFDCETVEEMY